MSGTSLKAGYLTPTVAGGAAPYDNALEDIVHDIFAGITGLPPQYVRPFFQPEPPIQPAASVDWMAFNIAATPSIANPAVIQNGPGPGDSLQEHEDLEILTSFYGPNAGANMNRLRLGLYVAQNRDMIKAAGLNMVSVGRPVRIPDLVNVQFINRIDLPVSLRRKISLTYNVQSLNAGLLTGNPISTIEP